MCASFWPTPIPMTPESLSLRFRIFLFFALIGLGGTALIGGGSWLAWSRIAPLAGPEAVPHLVLGGGLAAFGLLVLTAWVWQLFDQNVARPIQLLSGELTAKAEAGTAEGALTTAPARYLGELAPAADGIAKALGRAQKEKDAEVSAAIDQVLAEKAQLEAVLRDLRECVLICNNEHEILLYNSEAQRLLGLEAQIGLGRPLFRLVTEAPIAHALERLKLRVGAGRHTSHRDFLSVAVVCATRDGRLTLQGRVSLILDPQSDEIDGFVLTLRDATMLISDHAARDHLLKEMLEGLRRPSANLGAAAEILASGEMDPAMHERFVGVVVEEAGTLARRIDRLAGAYNELRIGGWSMNDVSSIALVACVRDRLADLPALEIAHEGPDQWMNCDSFTVVEMTAMLCRQITEAAGTGRIELEAHADHGHVFLDLAWEGVPIPEAASERWLTTPLVDGLAGLSARDVLLHHRTEIWSERIADGRARLRLPLQPAVEDHQSAPASKLPPRPEFYDFGLLRRSRAGALANTRLADLAFVVFDTETTGLFPSAGDEIVQIAGVRVLNGRVISGERFDRLVDPGRRIPAASTRIHGITDAMVADAPDARQILPEFHDFAADAVLVAHNAAFDMKFLQLKEGVIGRRFDNPVLDTVLLSAHLFGQEAEHTLDALAVRFGLSFPEGTRHTAIADAEVTAELLCRLLPVLEARGIATLADALAASEDAVAIRKQQARY